MFVIAGSQSVIDMANILLATRSLLQPINELQASQDLALWEPIFTWKIQIHLISTWSVEKCAFDVELIQGQALVGCQSARSAHTTELGCGGKVFVCFIDTQKSVVQSNRSYDLKNSEHELNPA